MKFVFLDFDGVLHSHYGHESTLWTFLPRVEFVLQEFPETRIVVSSSWEDDRNIDELRSLFSPDITPRVVDKVSTQARRMKPHGERGDARFKLCRRHKLRAGDWVAIDDVASLFRKQHPLIHCINGFRATQELQLRMVLENEIPAWRSAFDVVDSLFDFEVELDAQRIRDYVLAHRPDYGDGRTIAELLFARRRRPIEGICIS